MFAVVTRKWILDSVVLASTWMLVLVPAALFPIQLSAYSLGKQQRLTQAFGSLHLWGKPGWSSWIPALDQLGSGPCGLLGSEPAMEDFLYLSVKSALKNEKIFFKIEICLFSFGGITERDLNIKWFSLHMDAEAKTGLGWSQELHPGLPRGWHRSSHLH